MKKTKNALNSDKARVILLYGRVGALKQKLRQREKNDEIKALKKKGINPFSFTNIKDNMLNYQFQRNPFNPNKFKMFSMKKHIIDMENADRGIEKNRIEYVLRKIALNNVEAKSKLHIRDADELEELKRKIYKRKQTFRLETKKTEKISNKTVTLTSFPPPTKKRFSIIPPKHGKNYYMMQSLGNFYHDTESTRAKTAGNKGRSLQKKKTKVMSHPIGTTDINDFVKDYIRLKEQLKREQITFERRELMSFDDISAIMRTRSELKIMSLKQKYINCKFPKEDSEGNENKRDKLRDKIYTEVEQMDIEYY